MKNFYTDNKILYYKKIYNFEFSKIKSTNLIKIKKNLN